MKITGAADRSREQQIGSVATAISQETGESSEKILQTLRDIQEFPKACVDFWTRAMAIYPLSWATGTPVNPASLKLHSLVSILKEPAYPPGLSSTPGLIKEIEKSIESNRHRFEEKAKAYRAHQESQILYTREFDEKIRKGFDQQARDKYAPEATKNFIEEHGTPPNEMQLELISMSLHRKAAIEEHKKARDREAVALYESLFGDFAHKGYPEICAKFYQECAIPAHLALQARGGLTSDRKAQPSGKPTTPSP